MVTDSSRQMGVDISFASLEWPVRSSYPSGCSRYWSPNLSMRFSAAMSLGSSKHALASALSGISGNASLIAPSVLEAPSLSILTLIRLYPRSSAASTRALTSPSPPSPMAIPASAYPLDPPKASSRGTPSTLAR